MGFANARMIIRDYVIGGLKAQKNIAQGDALGYELLAFQAVYRANNRMVYNNYVLNWQTSSLIQECGLTVS